MMTRVRRTRCTVGLAGALLLLLCCPAGLPAADWFVAPGLATGDGGKAKPFNDPWRALAVAAPGDSIHIAEGIYFGRYDRSSWEIDRPRLTLLGGYDRQFRGATRGSSRPYWRSIATTKARTRTTSFGAATTTAAWSSTD